MAKIYQKLIVYTVGILTLSSATLFAVVAKEKISEKQVSNTSCNLELADISGNW